MKNPIVLFAKGKTEIQKVDERRKNIIMIMDDVMAEIENYSATDLVSNVGTCTEVF